MLPPLTTTTTTTAAAASSRRCRDVPSRTPSPRKAPLAHASAAAGAGAWVRYSTYAHSGHLDSSLCHTLNTIHGRSGS